MVVMTLSAASASGEVTRPTCCATAAMAGSGWAAKMTPCAQIRRAPRSSRAQARMGSQAFACASTSDTGSPAR